MCALVYIYKRAAQKTAGSSASSRRRRNEVPTPRRSADGATMAPRYHHADASALSRWFLEIVAQAPRRCRACISASSRWRLGIVDIVALAHRCCLAGVHFGIVALRLSIAALARRKRRSMFLFFLLDE
jgi:triphosphoribosyl-dephospho-CoA synthetase